MDCSKCDAKCCKENWLVRLTEEEVSTFNEAVVYQQFLQLPCQFLVNNQCNVYNKRPAVCRQYECDGDKRIWQTQKILTQL